MQLPLKNLVMQELWKSVYIIIMVIADSKQFDIV